MLTLKSGIAPFATSSDHLLAELERVDLMIRARVAHLRRVQSEDEHFRGLYISEQEVDALIARPLGEPQWLRGGDRSHLAGVDAALLELAELIASRRAASAALGIDLRLDRLAATFGLDRFDLDVLLMCLAVEIDLRYEKLYGYLQDDVTRRRPSVDLAIRLLARVGDDVLAARRHFQPGAPLISHQLVQLLDDLQQPQSPLLARILKPDERIVEFLQGSDECDARLGRMVTFMAPAHGLEGLLLDDAARAVFRNAWPEGELPAWGKTAPLPVLVMEGVEGSGRSSVAAALCYERGSNLLLVDVAAGPLDGDASGGSAATASPAIAAWAEREAALRHASLHWRGLERLSGENQRSTFLALMRALDAGHAPCFVALPDGVEALSLFPRRGATVLRMPEPTSAQRARRWSLSLGEVAHDIDLSGVAARYKLSFGKIVQAAATARRLAAIRNTKAAAVVRRDLDDACRMYSNQKLSALARKVAPTHGWKDIVLPDDCMEQLREICNQVMYRDRVFGDWGFGNKLSLGKGLAVLFSGPSGTGKTMAAGIIAAELGLDLYKIDLSTVISKYIGETEKNLSRIFDEAETSNAILFFDEADALFGKRSEVRDSHDRYANVEVGYLLQRMEEYEGIAILATNLRKNMDDAFIRRLHFTVEFPFPDEAHRLRIWQGIWPKHTPLEGKLDLKRLAYRYEIAGGNIKNIAVAAAFLAADDGQVVQMNHLVRATRREYQKTGKLMVDDETFGEETIRR